MDVRKLKSQCSNLEHKVIHDFVAIPCYKIITIIIVVVVVVVVIRTYREIQYQSSGSTACFLQQRKTTCLKVFGWVLVSFCSTWKAI